MNKSLDTVLVVDDDPNLLQLLRQILTREGYDVASAENGAEAIAQIEARPPCLMLSDYRLSDMNAEELTEVLDKKSVLPPFVIFTGRGDEATAVKMMKRGARDYLMKDTAFLELLPSVVSQTLDQIEKERRLEEAEEKLQKAFADIEKNRDDVLSILNSMRIGTAMTDENGRWTFLSDLCLRHFGLTNEEGIGKHWAEACSFQGTDRQKIRDMFNLPMEKRGKISVSLMLPDGVSSWMDVEVKDDPRNLRGKIFFFYDMSEVHSLRRMLDEKAQYEDLLGKSKAMQLVFQRIQEVANVDSTVLIEGDTGTGKELVARTIHATGHRENGPFIAVNCAGLSDSLLESQLFGHKRGSFTGAVENHKGFFEASNGGTLFLDEVGDIPLNVQTRLLRVLQEREITRLGESMPRKIDVRVLVATQHDLEKEVEAGRFRSDLFYRVRVARIELPSLEKRREDVPLLVRSFLRQHVSAIGKDISGVSVEAMGALTAHRWLGNVRELQNAIEFAVIRCQGSEIGLGDLPPEILQSDARPSAGEPASLMGERGQIMEALDKAGGNRSRAAQILGVSRATFYRHMSRLGIPSRNGS